MKIGEMKAAPAAIAAILAITLAACMSGPNKDSGPAVPKPNTDLSPDSVLRILGSIGVGAQPPANAEVLIAGGAAGGDSAALHTLLADKWKHWVGPYRSQRHMPDTPVIWKIVPDPETSASLAPSQSRWAVMTCCHSPEDAGGTVWGINDLLTRKTYRDMRLHVEFTLMGALEGMPGGNKPATYANSGVYLQNRYELQIKSPEKSITADAHEMGSLVDQAPALIDAMLPNGQWQAYDILFRAARWQGVTLLAPAQITVYWNGRLAHDRVAATAPATGGSSGVAVDSSAQGLKLQSEGTDVRYRNVWVQELDL
jgi:Domain of Unknown Function (DUF1080)